MNFLTSIEWSPLIYQEAAVIADEARRELLSRLEWMTIKPSVILDVGCGLCEGSVALQQHYPSAKIIALDAAQAMLQHAQQKKYPFLLLNSDAQMLPIAKQSVDVIFANLLLPWVQDFTAVLNEWRRVLRPNGLLMLTALGLDAMKEWHALFGSESIPHLIDMHELGDLLLQTGFSDPVVDVEYCTLKYKERDKLIAEAQASGMLASTIQNVKLDLLTPDESGKWPLTFEIIYAHTFAPLARKENNSNEIKIPLSQLRR